MTIIGTIGILLLILALAVSFRWREWAEEWDGEARRRSEQDTID